MENSRRRLTLATMPPFPTAIPTPTHSNIFIRYHPCCFFYFEFTFKWKTIKVQTNFKDHAQRIYFWLNIVHGSCEICQNSWEVVANWNGSIRLLRYVESHLMLLNWCWLVFKCTYFQGTGKYSIVTWIEIHNISIRHKHILWSDGSF